jgi:Cd2+/Zn2+-exporting ATPase
LEIAALGESCSNHPIAQSVLEAYANTHAGAAPELSRVGASEEIPGRGIRIPVDGKLTLLGNERLMLGEKIEFTPQVSAGTVIYVAQEGVFLGTIVISDTVKEGCAEAIGGLKLAGVEKCVMLTGDHRRSAEAVAGELGIDEFHAELLPADKVQRVETLLGARREGDMLAFVGDGINDAPVLSRVDVGIAMGSLGSDAAIEAADVVIMDDDIRKIPATVRLARKTMRIVRQNIVFALSVKAVILVLGAVGIANMWMAVFGDVGVSVIAILNSMRMLGFKAK